MMELKTNWTREDTYSPDAMNRVESITAQLAALLASVGYPAQLEPIKTDRTIESMEFADTLNRVENNITALHDAFAHLPGYVPPKEWAAGLPFDYRDANRLERNLLLLHTWLMRTVDGFKYCGTFSCGEGGEIY